MLRIPNKVTVAGLLGVLTLGVGDSMVFLKCLFAAVVCFLKTKCFFSAC